LLKGGMSVSDVTSSANIRLTAWAISTRSLPSCRAESKTILRAFSNGNIAFLPKGTPYGAAHKFSENIHPVSSSTGGIRSDFFETLKSTVSISPTPRKDFTMPITVWEIKLSTNIIENIPQQYARSSFTLPGTISINIAG
jgi:hypothetical protein